jgi:ATP-dependent Clp protease ATP-binding subunit ClpA
VKKVLALASKEAKALNHTFVGTEHILLGLLREGDGIAAKVLKNLDVNIEQTRQEVLRELDPNFSPQKDDETKEATSMSPRFEMPKNAESNDMKQDSIDTTKRYDVYCTERNQEVVVYRNALFKGIKRLYQVRQYDFQSDFLEMEQADGKTIFLSRNSVIKFCEHGVTPGAETISIKKLPA